MNQGIMKTTITEGAVGTGGSFVCLAVSMTTANAILQMISLCVGIAVGVVTFVSILRRMPPKK